MTEIAKLTGAAAILIVGIYLITLLTNSFLDINGDVDYPMNEIGISLEMAAVAMVVLAAVLVFYYLSTLGEY